LRWARERAGLDEQSLAKKMNVKPERVAEWESTGRITFKQIGRLAQHTRTPVGRLYLSMPEEDKLPIMDFRAAGGHPPSSPSPDLLETVSQMQIRQEWAREDVMYGGLDPLEPVGSLDCGDVVVAAQRMHGWLELHPGWQIGLRNIDEAFRMLRDKAEDAGVLVVTNGVVGNNTSRKLDPKEFRGFALADEYAPLVFVNAADSKAAQVFTLAHEIVHVLTGTAGVSGEIPDSSDFRLERLCNQVAAEFLLPAKLFGEDSLRISGNPVRRCERLSERYKVSGHAIALRLLHLGQINQGAYSRLVAILRERAAKATNPRSAGGDFYRLQDARVGRRFGRMVAEAVREDRLLYREAYLMTGLWGDPFSEYARKLGVEIG